MRLLWQTPDRYVAWWWALLVFAASTNMALWWILYRTVGAGAARIDGGSAMLFLSAAYVFGCAFRSFLPRADVQRFCLFDTWLSSIVIGRSVATIAEVAFAAQWALMLQLLGEVSGVSAGLTIAPLIVPLIVVAQMLSWYGVLTTNALANAVENSVWAFTFALIGTALLQMMPAFNGAVWVAMAAASLGIGAYLAFLVLVDIPMYISRRRAAPQEDFLTLHAGLKDAARRRIVTHDLAHWRDEIPWMSLYFTTAVWASLFLSLGYAMSHQLPTYRIDAAAPHVLIGFEPSLDPGKPRP